MGQFIWEEFLSVKLKIICGYGWAVVDLFIFGDDDQFVVVDDNNEKLG